VLILRPTNLPKTFSCPLVPLVPMLGILVNTLLFTSLPQEAIYRVLVWSGLGFLIYFFYGVSHSKLNAPNAPKKHDSSSPQRRKIWFFALDGSEECWSCFQSFVLDFAQPSRGDHIVLFTVEEDIENADAAHSRIAKFTRFLQGNQSILKGLTHEVNTKVGSHQKKAIGQEICNVARQMKCDYIVTGCRSNSPSKTVLGSVSEYVLGRSPCPVVVVNPRN